MIKRMQAPIPKIRKWFQWLLSQQGGPGNQARGLASGIFFGCFPLFGFQTFLGIVLASLLRGNRLLAAIGTWISNPFTYLPLYWFNYQIGLGLLKNEENHSKISQITYQSLWEQGWIISMQILLGSTVVGLFTALISGVLFYQLLKKKQNQRKN